MLFLCLKDAIVLVGTSALGLTDLRTTPLQTGYPGVEIHANLLDAIIQSTEQANNMYYRPDWEPGLTFLLLIISGLAFVWILPLTRACLYVGGRRRMVSGINTDQFSGMENRSF
jgi:CHASE2 domain-containing sensor protein